MGNHATSTRLTAELVQKDYHLGLLAQIAEMEYRLRRLEEQLDLETERLEQEMTRAYLAESRITTLEQELAELQTIRRRLKQVHESATWKIGRFIMIPVRIMRRITSR